MVPSSATCIASPDMRASRERLEARMHVDSWSGSCRRRIDHSLDLGGSVAGNPLDFRVPFDGSDVFCQVDAEGLVCRNKGLDPLDIGAELGQRRVGGLRRIPSWSRSNVPTFGISRSIMYFCSMTRLPWCFLPARGYDCRTSASYPGSVMPPSFLRARWMALALFLLT